MADDLCENGGLADEKFLTDFHICAPAEKHPICYTILINVDTLQTLP